MTPVPQRGFSSLAALGSSCVSNPQVFSSFPTSRMPRERRKPESRTQGEGLMLEKQENAILRSLITGGK